MRTMWLGVSFAILSRSRGQTALLRSVYQTGGTATDREGVAKTFEMSPGEHRGTWVLVPPRASDWARDARRLWEAAGSAERQWNAQEARRLDIQVPRGVPDELIGDLVQALYGVFVDGGLAVQVDYHVTKAKDGKLNPHLHAIISTRSIGVNGFAKTKTAARSWNQFFHRGGRAIREFLAEKLNRFLAAHDIAVRVDPRPNSERELPTAEWRLPRSARKRSDSEYARAQLAAIEEHRELRADWEAAHADEVEAAAEVERLDAELDETRRLRVSIRARSQRYRPVDLAADVETYAFFEGFLRGEPTRSTLVTEGMIKVTSGSTAVTVEDDWLCVDGDCDDDALAIMADLRQLNKWGDFDVVGTEQLYDARTIYRLIRRATRSFDPVEHWLSVYENDSDVEFAVRNRKNTSISPSAAAVVDVIENAEVDALQALKAAQVTHWQIYAAVQSLQFSAISYRLAQRSARVALDYRSDGDEPAMRSP